MFKFFNLGAVNLRYRGIIVLSWKALHSEFICRYMKTLQEEKKKKNFKKSHRKTLRPSTLRQNWDVCFPYFHMIIELLALPPWRDTAGPTAGQPVPLGADQWEGATPTNVFLHCFHKEFIPGTLQHSF